MCVFWSHGRCWLLGTTRTSLWRSLGRAIPIFAHYSRLLNSEVPAEPMLRGETSISKRSRWGVPAEVALVKSPMKIDLEKIDLEKTTDRFFSSFSNYFFAYSFRIRIGACVSVRAGGSGSAAATQAVVLSRRRRENFGGCRSYVKAPRRTLCCNPIPDRTFHLLHVPCAPHNTGTKRRKSHVHPPVSARTTIRLRTPDPSSCGQNWTSRSISCHLLPNI